MSGVATGCRAQPNAHPIIPATPSVRGRGCFLAHGLLGAPQPGDCQVPLLVLPWLQASARGQKPTQTLPVFLASDYRVDTGVHDQGQPGQRPLPPRLTAPLTGLGRPWGVWGEVPEGRGISGLEGCSGEPCLRCSCWVFGPGAQARGRLSVRWTLPWGTLGCCGPRVLRPGVSPQSPGPQETARLWQLQPVPRGLAL